MRRALLGIIIFVFALTGCQRAKNDKKSTITIETPRWSQKSEGSLVALPSQRKPCYGVSISGPGIETHSGSCSPQLGALAGYVGEGGTIELQVPSGQQRKIDLYMYLLPANSNASCPQLVHPLAMNDLQNIYLVGSVSGVNLVNEVETVEIPVNFTGVHNHIARQLTLPATCVVAGPSNSTFQISAGAGIAKDISSTIRLKGRIGVAVPAASATGGSIRLDGKIK